MPKDKSKFTLVVDRTNASSVNQDIDLMEHIAGIFQVILALLICVSSSSLRKANFPERLHRVIVYPTGFMFYGIWNLVQYFLHPTTREKVCPQMSTQGCLQFVDPEYLPVTMGGTSTYEPDIENIEEPPPMIHSVLYKTKRLTDLSRRHANGQSNGISPMPMPSSSSSTLSSSSSSSYLSKIGDYRSVSVSIDMNEDEDLDEGELYAESEFGDDYSSMLHDSIAEPTSSAPSTDAVSGGSSKHSNDKQLMKLPNFQFSSKQFCPAMMRGWGIKQGHIVKNWKRRYFILTSDSEVTLLRYFKGEQPYPPYGDYLCGELNLQYYHLIPSKRQIRFDSNEEERTCHCLELVGESSLDKDMLICIEISSEYHSWIGALEAHIDYRKEIQEIAQETAGSSSIWRCNLL
jgi:hypothetical protein